MRIPPATIRPRFYVASSMTAAFSSWSTLEEARASYQRFKETAAAPDAYHVNVSAFAEIIGIVEVGPTGAKVLHPAEP